MRKQPKHPNGKSITKNDLVRAMTEIILKYRTLEQKFVELDGLFAEYLEFNDDRKKFEKFLDGKYKSKKRRRGTKSIKTSKE